MNLKNQSDKKNTLSLSKGLLWTLEMKVMAEEGMGRLLEQIIRLEK